MADLGAAYVTACETGAYRPRRRKKAASTLAQERWVWGKYLKDGVGGDAIGSITETRVRGPGAQPIEQRSAAFSRGFQLRHLGGVGRGHSGRARATPDRRQARTRTGTGAELRTLGSDLEQRTGFIIKRKTVRRRRSSSVPPSASPSSWRCSRCSDAARSRRPQAALRPRRDGSSRSPRCLRPVGDRRPHRHRRGLWWPDRPYDQLSRFRSLDPPLGRVVAGAAILDAGAPAISARDETS